MRVIGTNPTDEPITFGLPLIECLLEVDRALYQMKRSGDGAGTAAVRLNAGLGGVPEQCVSITLVPFSVAPEEYGPSDLQSTASIDRAAGLTLIQILLARTRPSFATILLPPVGAGRLPVL